MKSEVFSQCRKHVKHNLPQINSKTTMTSNTSKLTLQLLVSLVMVMSAWVDASNLRRSASPTPAPLIRNSRSSAPTNTPTATDDYYFETPTSQPTDSLNDDYYGDYNDDTPTSAPTWSGWNRDNAMYPHIDGDCLFNMAENSFERGVFMDIATSRDQFDPIVAGFVGRKRNPPFAQMSVFRLEKHDHNHTNHNHTDHHRDNNHQSQWRSGSMDSMDSKWSWTEVISSALKAGRLNTAARNGDKLFMGGALANGSIYIVYSTDGGDTLKTYEAIDSTPAIPLHGMLFGSGFASPFSNQRQWNHNGLNHNSPPYGNGPVVDSYANTAYIAGSSYNPDTDSDNANSSPIVLKTTDSGAHWTALTLPGLGMDQTLPRGVAAYENNVIVVGSLNQVQAIWSSHDGGSTFANPLMFQENTLTDVAFSTKSTAFAVGSMNEKTATSATLLRSKSAGDDWQTILTAAGRLFGLAVFDTRIVAAVGIDQNGYGVVYRTTDQGKTWGRIRPNLGINYYFSIALDLNTLPCSGGGRGGGHGGGHGNYGNRRGDQGISKCFSTRTDNSTCEYSTATVIVGSTGTSSDGRGVQLIAQCAGTSTLEDIRKAWLRHSSNTDDELNQDDDLYYESSRRLEEVREEKEGVPEEEEEVENEVEETNKQDEEGDGEAAEEYEEDDEDYDEEEVVVVGRELEEIIEVTRVVVEEKIEIHLESSEDEYYYDDDEETKSDSNDGSGDDDFNSHQ